MVENMGELKTPPFPSNQAIFVIAQDKFPATLDPRL